MFRGGLAIAAIGLVWTMSPAPGDRAYPAAHRGEHSAYRRGPRVTIDLGHWNGSPGDARLLGLADLLTWDGYQVTRSRQHLVPELLEDARVLVVAGPLSFPPILRPAAAAMGWADRPAFGPDEAAAVRDWVLGGGGLLLAANTAGSAAASAPLAAAFGLAFHECPADRYFAQATLGEHPLLAGIHPEYEAVQFAAATAHGWVAAWPAGGGPAVPVLLAPAAAGFCAAGKPLAAALEFGRGRVVALAAQLERPQSAVGRPGNRQLTLNIFHWLSRAGN